MARPGKTKASKAAAKVASSAAKLGALRGIPADLIELESSDTLAILAFVQIHHSAELIVKAAERNLATHNLSLARYVVLRLLAGREPVPLGWIAEKHFSRMSNITGVIDRLVRDGLVERLPDSTDRRIVRVKLTAAGDKLLRATRKPHREFLAKTMSPLSDEELRSLVVLLSKLTQPLEGGRPTGM